MLPCFDQLIVQTLCSPLELSCILVLDTVWERPSFFYYHLCHIHKVVFFLEACFDLISSSSLSMKIQIMGGKITENLGFESPLRKVKKFVSFFIFKFFKQNWVSLILTTFLHLILILRNQIKSFENVCFY